MKKEYDKITVVILTETGAYTFENAHIVYVKKNGEIVLHEVNEILIQEANKEFADKKRKGS